MKKMTHAFVLFLSLLLIIALFAGCGSSESSRAYSTGGTTYEPSYNSSSSYSGEYDAAPESGWYEAETANTSSTVPANVKMIYTADISLESTAFDDAVAKLNDLVAEMGGWYESSRLNNESQRYRRAYFTIRVPAQNFQLFCTKIGDLCKVNELYTNSDDVSEYYYDLESRLVTQRTKLERLQALLAAADKMEDIITLESAISETELAIENLTGSLRHYDSLVDYSTIDVSLSEVYQLTQTEEPAIGFGAKLSAAFRAGSSSFVSGLQDLLLGFARGWIGWLIFLVIVAVVVILIVRGSRKSRKKRAAYAQQFAQQPPVAPPPQAGAEKRQK